MVLDQDPRLVLRQELSRIYKNQRVIRAFEKIFDLIPPEFINQQEQLDLIVSELSQIQSVGSIEDQTAELQKQLQDLKLPPSMDCMSEVQKQLSDLQQGPII